MRYRTLVLKLTWYAIDDLKAGGYYNVEGENGDRGTIKSRTKRNYVRNITEKIVMVSSRRKRKRVTKSIWQSKSTGKRERTLSLKRGHWL